MSLINDALKKAAQAQKDNPSAPKPAPHLQPKTPEPPKKGGNLPVKIAIGAAVLLAVILGWHFLSSNSTEQVNARTDSPTVTNRPPDPDAVIKAALSDTPPAPPVAPPPPPKPKLRLQAVMYDPRRPVAMIGGESLMVGDRIGEYRVRAITIDSVTLVSKTETNVLKVSVD